MLLLIPSYHPHPRSRGEIVTRSTLTVIKRNYLRAMVARFAALAVDARKHLENDITARCRT